MHNQEAFSTGKAAAIIVAAGSGSRLGGAIAKQFRALGGKPMLLWSVETMLRCNKLATIVVVVPPGETNQVRDMLPRAWRLHVVAGGASRTESVRAGLAALDPICPARVLIHDAARPGLTADVIEELLTALDTADAAAPALAVADALKSTPEIRSVSRDGLMRVQTPQAFRWDAITAAYASTKHAAVDDLALVEAAGAKITLTPGRHELMKVTYAEDLAVAEKLIAGPTVREADGLAMSSRNRYLSPEERAQALCLPRALEQVRKRFAAGERRAAALTATARRIIEAAPLALVEYIAMVDEQTLAPIKTVRRRCLVALAVRIGTTRLIDNTVLTP